MCIIRMCMILIIELKLGIDNGKIAIVSENRESKERGRHHERDCK